MLFIYNTFYGTITKIKSNEENSKSPEYFNREPC